MYVLLVTMVFSFGALTTTVEIRSDPKDKQECFDALAETSDPYGMASWLEPTFGTVIIAHSECLPVTTDM